MKRLCSLISAILLLLDYTDAQNLKLSESDFLKEFYDLGSLPAYVSRSYSAEVSTYDRSGLNNDGFNGTYSYIRRNRDSSLVIFDVKGAGLINRIWTPTPSDDSLDFFIDTDSTPNFTICYRDLFSGKQYPFIPPLCANQLGGYFCYLPIPFSKSCKIVFRGKSTRFHQIGYRLYPPGITVKSFRIDFDKEEQTALAAIRESWKSPRLRIEDRTNEKQKMLTSTKELILYPGASSLALDLKQGGRILALELSGNLNLANEAKNIDIKVTWDGEALPAIYCPLADYFGYASGKPSMKSLLVGADRDLHYSYFPMPFDRSAKIEFLYRKTPDHEKAAAVSFRCTVISTDRKRVQETEGKFYANWHRENPVAMHSPYPMLNIKGKGHFVGTVLQAQGLKPGMTLFFEGDDSTVVDGELRMHGTGSEDFFNGGWYALLDCWDAAMSLPLSGSLEYSTALCRTGGYRLFLNDKISFEKSFFQSIEHGPEHNEVPADYSSVSYYYCSQLNPQTLIPSQKNTALFFPDTMIIYPQLLNMAFDGDAAIRTKWEYPTGGLTFYYTITAETILRISLTGIPTGKYRMLLDYVKTPLSTDFSVWQRQTKLTEFIAAGSEQPERILMQDLCDLELTPLNNTVSFRFGAAGNKDQFILNRLILVKK